MKFAAILTAFLSSLALTSAQGTAANNNYAGVDPAHRRYLNATQAQTILEAAVREAAVTVRVPMNIAIMDPSARLIAFFRMDNAFLGSIEISQKKAKTVALFNGAFTTAQWYNMTQPGQSLYAIQETNDGLIVFGGGVPVNIGGVFYGAVGVSGGTTAEDEQVAYAGARAVGGYVPPS